MKLSTKSRYGLRLMVDVAASSPQGPVLLADIAQRQGVSEKYLWNLAAPLKAAGYLTAQRGVHGGYLLGRRAEEITVKDIVVVLEGPLSLVDCQDCSRLTCVTRPVWQKATEAIDQVFSSYKLSDLAQDERRMRGQAQQEKGPVFGV